MSISGAGNSGNHGFAIYFKLTNWPLVKENLSERFEVFELCRFFKATGRALSDHGLTAETNPSLTLKPGIANPHMVEYLGFGGPETPLSRRDRQACDTAKRKYFEPHHSGRAGMPS